MRLGLLGDIHGNLHAFEAVLDEVARLRVDRTVCLGDLVGYNAFPSQCISLARTRCERIVMGNHDREVGAEEPTIGTSSSARAAQLWTREQLSPDELQWLSALPNKDVEEGRYIAVHGCYLNDFHVNGYVTQTMLKANLVAVARHEGWPKLAFCGHTHVPMLASLQWGEPRSHAAVGEVELPLGSDAILINPGAVGQPRDGDPRAAFAVVDLEVGMVEFHRVAYDVAAAAAAVNAAGLPPALSERLFEGR